MCVRVLGPLSPPGLRPLVRIPAMCLLYVPCTQISGRSGESSVRCERNVAVDTWHGMSLNCSNVNDAIGVFS